VRVIIGTGDEMSIFDSPGKVFSPKCKEDSSNLYAGLMINNHNTVIRNTYPGFWWSAISSDEKIRE